MAVEAVVWGRQHSLRQKGCRNRTGINGKNKRRRRAVGRVKSKDKCMKKEVEYPKKSGKMLTPYILLSLERKRLPANYNDDEQEREGGGESSECVERSGV
jgi:hypothetical protein